MKNSRIFQKATIHIVAWLLLFSFPFWFGDRPPKHFRFLEYLENNLFMVVLFYINYAILIPYLFSRKKFLKYFLSIIATTILLIVLMYAIKEHENDFARVFFRTFWWGILIIGISTSIKVTQKWLISETQKKEIENEKLSSELAFLKSQISPHFLFNTLNNIYSLAYKKSDDAPTAIVKLSSLMRYMLYDSKENRVFLNNEIEYLQNYIDLQRLRLDDTVEIQFKVEGDVEAKLIEPLLLIPFVENAFKHGISYKEKSNISIHLNSNNSELSFYVNNSIPNNTTFEKKNNSGIGLTNIQRRLELLYPNKHSIKISNKNQVFKTELHLLFD